MRVSVAQHDVEFVNWGFYDAAPWRNYLHTHSFYEVCYAYAGHGAFRVGGRAQEVGAGALFLARPGDVHEIVSSDDDPLGIYFWAYTLVRGPRAAGGAARAASSALREPDAGRLLEAFAESSEPRVREQPWRVAALLDLLTCEAATPGPGHNDVVAALTTSLVLETARAFQDRLAAPQPAPSGGDGVDASAVRTMVRYLNDNYNRRVSVRDVAAQVHLSARHAARLFRQATGSSVHAYLTRLRLEAAAQRLLERGTSVKEVAHACGYPDVRHFTTAFRRHWGAPPATFRDRNGTTHLGRRS